MRQSNNQKQPKLPKEEMMRKAKFRCMKLLEYADRTEQQLRRRLEDEGFSKDEVDAAIEYVKNYHYLDDERFAENYAMQQGGRKSIRKMAQDLTRKGVSAECIEEVLEKCRDKEEETARRVLEKYARGKDISQDRVRWSMVRYLAGKGFSYDLAKHLVEQLCEDRLEE